MPRAARNKSKSGVYHIIVRGINRQDIFQDEEDKGIYLDRILRYKEECGFEIYAYCLMDNHVHLLIRESEEEISKVMKKIGTSYVFWYNRKYERVGHLFQDRYKSENIENDAYLLTVMRYIHQNPKKVGKSIESWTSYKDYIEKSNLTDVEFMLELFDHDIEKFKSFLNEDSKDRCMDIETENRMSDNKAKEIINETIKSENYQALQIYDKKTRDDILRTLKEKGLSVRQIERITGINRGVILKA